MPVVEDFEPIISYLRDKLPQLGFFSTLDDAIKSAPFEKASPEQWKNYLKPGLTVQRHGVMFPLKAEELHYAQLHPFLDAIASGDPDRLRGLQQLYGEDAVTPQAVSKEAVRQHVQRNRPQFDVDTRIQNSSPGTLKARLPEPNLATHPDLTRDQRIQLQDRFRSSYGHAPQFMEYAHVPGVPSSYEESITKSPDFGMFQSHFTPRDISWSRTTRHSLDPSTPTSPTARLIEEIQSDRHEAAAEKAFLPTPQELAERNSLLAQLPSGADPYNGVGSPERESIAKRITDLENQAKRRRGYRAPEEEQALLTGERNTNFDLAKVSAKPPDTPFKDPVDYALLELKKQLLNSIHQGDSYMALTRGADQVNRWEQGMGGGKGEGMTYTYDKVYPSALKKLARMYGANVTDLSLPVAANKGDFRTPTMAEFGMDRPSDAIEGFVGGDIPSLDEAKSVLSELQGLADPNDSYLQNRLRKASYYLSQASDLWDSDKAEWLKDNPDSDENDFAMNDEPSSSVRSYLRRAGSHLDDIYDSIKAQHGSVETQTKSFPAMHITPQIADLVRKAGVPLFVGAGATLGANQMSQSNSPTQPTGYASGGVVSPLDQYVQSNVSSNPSGGDGYLSFLLRAQAMGMGLPPADTIFDPIPGMPVGMAKGGSTSPLADMANGIISASRNPMWGLNPKHSPELARLAVRAASQLYGVGPKGNAVFMGWMNPTRWGEPGFLKEASSPKILQEVMSVPDQATQFAILLRQLAKKYAPSFMLGSHHPTSTFQAMDPQWSQQASQEISKINDAVDRASGLGHAHSIAGDLMNVTGDVAPLLGVAHLADEGTMGRHILNEVAGWGGGAAGQQPTSSVAPHLSQAQLQAIFTPSTPGTEPDLVAEN